MSRACTVCISHKYISYYKFIYMYKPEEGKVGIVSRPFGMSESTLTGSYSREELPSNVVSRPSHVSGLVISNGTRCVALAWITKPLKASTLTSLKTPMPGSTFSTQLPLKRKSTLSHGTLLQEKHHDLES